jgi:hypothetical protein
MIYTPIFDMLYMRLESLGFLTVEIKCDNVKSWSCFEKIEQKEEQQKTIKIKKIRNCPLMFSNQMVLRIVYVRQNNINYGNVINIFSTVCIQ